MGVDIKRKTPVPVTTPIETVTLKGVGGRSIVVRPTSTDGKAVRTVQCTGHSGAQFKWAATLGDLRAFGQALIDIADGA